MYHCIVKKHSGQILKKLQFAINSKIPIGSLLGVKWLVLLEACPEV
jgi:hypothetical protein